MDLINDSYIAYVNLDSRPNRQRKMERALAQVGIQAHRHRGMLPSEYTGDPARIKAMWERPQKGAIGCHFAQVGVIKEALKRGKHAWVMEDDLVFCRDFRQRLWEIEKFMDRNPWDIFWLGATFHIGPARWHCAPNPNRGCRPLGTDALREFRGASRFIRTFGCFCTYAYIVNHKSIKNVLARMEERLPESIGIDHLMIMIQPDLLTYAYVPGSVKQYDHLSDIGVDSRGRPSETRFSTMCRLNGTEEATAYWWQDRASDFNPEQFDWKEAAC